MKTAPQKHLDRPWRVHALAKDFELIDTWSMKLEGDFPAFVERFWRTVAELDQMALGRLRLAIGRVFGWDARPHTLPIPGCTELSVSDRLSPAERADEPSPFPVVAAKTVYRSPDEVLF